MLRLAYYQCTFRTEFTCGNQQSRIDEHSVEEFYEVLLEKVKEELGGGGPGSTTAGKWARTMLSEEELSDYNNQRSKRKRDAEELEKNVQKMP
ncbi:hypothetical protein OSTOST_05783 [Ostertagia ostertagi]